MRRSSRKFHQTLTVHMVPEDGSFVPRSRLITVSRCRGLFRGRIVAAGFSGEIVTLASGDVVYR